MSILIKGMEMPKRGMVVNIYADGRVTNHFDEFGKTIGKAVPVPPHGRLIDANVLLNAMKKAGEDDSEIVDVYEQDYTFVSGWIYTVPTVIPAEEDEV